jgi:hypothetical protein
MSTVTLDRLTSERNIAQLARGNARSLEVRRGHSAIKAHVHLAPAPESRQRAAGVLLAPSEHVLSMRIGVLLRSTWRAEDRHVRGWLLAAGVWSEDRRVGDLTERQRLALAEALR